MDGTMRAKENAREDSLASARRHRSSGVRPSIVGPPSVARRALVLSTGDAARVRATVDALRTVADPTGRVVVVGPRVADPALDLDALEEPMDRGTGIRLLLALVLRSAADAPE